MSAPCSAKGKASLSGEAPWDRGARAAASHPHRLLSASPHPPTTPGKRAGRHWQSCHEVAPATASTCQHPGKAGTWLRRSARDSPGAKRRPRADGKRSVPACPRAQPSPECPMSSAQRPRSPAPSRAGAELGSTSLRSRPGPARSDKEPGLSPPGSTAGRGEARGSPCPAAQPRRPPRREPRTHRFGAEVAGGDVQAGAVHGRAAPHGGSRTAASLRQPSPAQPVPGRVPAHSLARPRPPPPGGSQWARRFPAPRPPPGPGWPMGGRWKASSARGGQGSVPGGRWQRVPAQARAAGPEQGRAGRAGRSSPQRAGPGGYAAAAGRCITRAGGALPLRPGDGPRGWAPVRVCSVRSMDAVLWLHPGPFPGAEGLGQILLLLRDTRVILPQSSCSSPLKKRPCIYFGKGSSFQL